MNKNSVRGLLAAGLLLPLGVASAAELAVAPAIDLAYKSSDFTIAFFGGSGTSLIKPSYTTLTPSLALNYGRFYGVAAYESTVDDWNSTSLEVSSPTSNSFIQQTFERNEASLTFGYRVLDGSGKLGAVNVFAGYLQGVSGWNSTTFRYSAAPAPVSIKNLNVNFNEKGLFVGANYSQPFGSKGTLSLSAAYGFLSGLLNDVETSGGSSSTNQDLYSKSNGLSVGLAWSGNLTGNMNYRVGLKYIKYNFDVDRIDDKLTGTSTSVTPGMFVIKEQIYSLNFGVINYF